MDQIVPYSDFREACAATLHALRQRLPFDLWMVTRHDGEHWVILQTEDHGYDMASRGTLFRWADSFCSLMVEGKGPRVAPESNRIPAYAGQAIGKQVNIGAYIGVPLARPDGSVFGTMCAIHPSPQPDDIRKELQLVEVFSRLLSTILARELEAQQQVRRAERAQAIAMKDGQTGLFNRHGWNHLLAAEQARCLRYGHPASVLLLRLSGVDAQSAPTIAAHAAHILKSISLDSDIVARLAPTEFALLCVESGVERAELLKTQAEKELQTAQINASISVAHGPPLRDLATASAEAADHLSARRV